MEVRRRCRDRDCDRGGDKNGKRGRNTNRDRDVDRYSEGDREKRGSSIHKQPHWHLLTPSINTA